MARFLFVVPPLAGHVNPTVAVGRALIRRGHEVAWVGYSSIVRGLLPADLRLIGLEEDGFRGINENWLARARAVFGLDSFKFFFAEFLIPLADAMLPGVRAAIEAYAPDFVVADQQAPAGALGARLRGLPWATSATTSAAVFNPVEQFPKVNEWMVELFGQLQDRYGLARWTRPDLSENLVLIFTVPELVGDQGTLPASYRFVGPSIREETDAAEFPWERLRKEKPRVYLSLGTLNAERSTKFYAKVKEAFAGEGLQMILSAPPELLGEIPDNFIVRKRVPQLALLAQVDAVVFHGGHNTLCEALYHGRPLVVAPIKDDQPVIAGQVTRSGAGIRVHFDRVKSGELRDAVFRVLTEPAFREAAARVQKSLRGHGGAEAAADLLVAAWNDGRGEDG